MKKRLLLCLLLLGGLTVAKAQLPPGTVAPDFTATDLDGNTHNLYDLLDAGKTVYLDFSATWCGPCWNYHNTHAFRDIWEMYGPDGTDEAYVLFIESDASTNTACLYGPSGCVGGTQGDWVTGTPYPIIDDASIASSYAISYYPTIYMVCPADKKVYETGQLNATGLWNRRTTYCTIPSVNLLVQNVQNVRCYDTNTGSINISASGGNPPYTYIWSNGATTEDLVNVPAGTYTVTVTSSNGWTGESDPIDVEGPASPLMLEVVETTPVGCNGVLGSITVNASGGWSENYTYFWSVGQTGETAYNLNSGNYTVSVTDNNNCTVPLTTFLPPAVYPTASIAPPGALTCAQSQLQLDATASSSGNEYSYLWYASNGGHIVSGGNTPTPTVDSAGTYTIQVTNVDLNCSSFSSVSVSSNIDLPSAEAGPALAVTCSDPDTLLEGSGSSGSNFTYTWTAFNGGHIVSGGNTLTPLVDSVGTYVLKVTNTANSCVRTDTTTVAGGNTPPAIDISNGLLTCDSTTVTLETSVNTSHPTFVWTGPGGFSSNEQNPTVTMAGAYALALLDTVTACANVDTAIVAADLAPPGASATGGSITCLQTSVTLNASSPDTTATYAWTGPGGFSSSEQNPVVNAGGDYILTVHAGDNGCISLDTAVVSLNNAPPTASAVAPGNLNCINDELQLDGTGSSQGSSISYLWTTVNGNIVSGETSATPLVDAVGTYTLQVTNATTGCTNTASVNVIQSTTVNAAISGQTNVACNGQTNGTATATANGGNGVYTYLWSNGDNTAQATNLSAGAFFVTVTDGEGCTATSSVIISEPAVLAPNASATAQTGVGLDDGTATAAPAGGTPNYAYLWSNGETTATITGLAPGNYTVTVTDANNCTAVQTVTVNTFNCALSATISGTNVRCNGGADGTASVSVLGQADPVTYLWSNGAETASVENLAAGNYSVEITDGNGCAVALSITITQPVALDPNATATSESSAGANDGTATANVAGGTAPYTYLWSNGETTQAIANLAPGVYTVVVTDAQNCTAEETVTVNSFNCAINATVNVTHVSCAGANDGTAVISLIGGTAPFTYVWSNGGTGSSQNNLSGGQYQITITDDEGCETEISASVNEPDPLQVSVLSLTHVDCPNSGTGAISMEVQGGTQPYSYLWSNGATTPQIGNLNAGNYVLTTTDGNGCTSSLNATVLANDNIAPEISAPATATVPIGASGTAVLSLANLNITATDNCGQVSASFSPASFDCSELGTHTVSVTVTDQNGNTNATTVDVTVVDQTAPVLTCPASLSVCPEDNIVQYSAPVATDNCLGNGGDWDLLSGLPSGSEFPVGVTTQTYSFTDASGNTGTCSFSVEVYAPINAAYNVTNATNNQSNGAIDVTASGNGPLGFVWTSNGQVVGETEDLSGIPAGEYTLEITDANGCVRKLIVTVSNSVSSKEPGWMKQVQVQPNPANQYIQVVFRNLLPTDLNLSLLDATGRELVNLHADRQSVVDLEVGHLPEGVYVLKIRSGAEIGVRKIVISH